MCIIEYEQCEVKNMRKAIVLLVLCFLAASLVLAVGEQGANGQGNDSVPENNAPETQGEGQGAGQEEPVNTNVENQNEQLNQGEETQIQNQEKIQTQLKEGEFIGESGQKIQVQQQTNNMMQLKVGDASANTGMDLVQEQTQEKTKITAKLSNGQNAEIKVMPDAASERAMERLELKVCSEENDCQMELKEVGKGDQIKAAYEVKAQKQAKLFGLFRTKMQVQAQIDAESGEVIQTKKPWWAFLASEE